VILKSTQEWFSASELAGLDGMPMHPTNVTRKAKSASWKKRQTSGTKGVTFEYHVSSLPESTQTQLASLRYRGLSGHLEAEMRKLSGAGVGAISDLENELSKPENIKDRLFFLAEYIEEMDVFANKHEISGSDLVDIRNKHYINPTWILTGHGYIIDRDDMSNVSNERVLAILASDEEYIEKLNDEGEKYTSYINELINKIKNNIPSFSVDDAGILASCFASSNIHKCVIDSLISKLSSLPSIINDDFALIPGYQVQVSAGSGLLAPDIAEPIRYLAFRKKWLQFKDFNQYDLSVVWAKGDSMHPTISDNDTLVVHMGRKQPKDGYIYVFRNGEELFVKRYQNALGSWRLISDNSLYAPLEVKKEEQHQFEVIGQVVHVAKDIAD
jgi:hypothetical protein